MYQTGGLAMSKLGVVEDTLFVLCWEEFMLVDSKLIS